MKSDEYARHHRHWLDLVIHIATVPLFLLSLVGMLAAPFVGGVPWFMAALAVVLYCLWLQRFGHGLEPMPPPAPAGVLAWFQGLLREQLVDFPRFVASGDLARAWRSGMRDLGARRGR